MLTDVRHAWQGLRRAPGHLLAAVTCLGIGLAICVAAFSAIIAFLFGDVPGIANRGRLPLVAISYEGVSGADGVGAGRIGSANRLSTSDFEVFTTTHGPAFQAVASEGLWAFPLRLGRGNGRMRGAFVSGSYFHVLGTTPTRGRLLGPADDQPDAAAVAVVGYELWTLLLGGRDDIIGSSIALQRRTFTIIGVAPRRFTGILVGEPGRSAFDAPQIWVPLHHASSFAGTPARDAAWHTVVGRLAGDLRLSDARRSMRVAAASIEAAAPAVRRHTSIVLYGIDPRDNPALAVGAVTLLMLLPLTVLAVACANVANLQLARATERARELAVRLALGASRLQVTRPLTIESALISSAAAVVGWGGAALGLRAADGVSPVPLHLDARVFAFAALLVVGVIFLSGWVPAWLTARRSAAAGLRQTSQSGGLAHARLRNSLVALQVALSLVLIFVTALALRSLGAMAASVPDYAREVVIVPLNLAEIDATPADGRRIVDAAITRLSADKRVSAAGAAGDLLDIGLRYWLTGDGPAIRRVAAGGVVTPSWFNVVKARPIAGRLLSEQDTNAPVAVVSSELAGIVAPGGVRRSDAI
jgi:predicted permease